MRAACSAGPWAAETKCNSRCSAGTHRAEISLLTMIIGRENVKEREREKEGDLSCRCVRICSFRDTGYICIVESGIYDTDYTRVIDFGISAL